MKNTSKCRQCGNSYPFRSNKSYCSLKCKNAANNQNKKQLFTDDHLPANDQKKSLPITEKGKDSKVNNRKALLQIRRMELEHQQYLAKLQAEEREKDREFEIKKLKAQKEEQEAKLKAAKIRLEELNKKHSSELNESTNQSETADEKTTQKTKGNNEIPIRESLAEKFKDIVTDFLDGNECEWSEWDIKELMNWVKEWQQQMREWAKKRKVRFSGYPEWQMINDLEETLKEMEDELSQRGFWDSQGIYLELEQEWIDELQKAVE